MGLVDEWTTAYHISYSNDTSSEYHDMKDSGNDVKVCNIVHVIFIEIIEKFPVNKKCSNVKCQLVISH